MADFDAIRFQPQRPLLRELSADRLNSILAEIKRNKPKGERGITVRQDGNQTWIGLAASLPRGTTPATTHPFKISSRQNPDNENQYLVAITPGTANNIIAQNTFDGAELREFTLAKDALGYAVLTAATNGKEITSTTLSVTTTQPGGQAATMFTLPTEIKFTLGIVYNGTVHQLITDNINVAGKIVYTKDKATAAAPGQLPFEIWYVWQ